MIIFKTLCIACAGKIQISVFFLSVIPLTSDLAHAQFFLRKVLRNNQNIKKWAWVNVEHGVEQKDVSMG